MVIDLFKYVKVGNRVLIVGVGEDIELLKEIKDREKNVIKLLDEYNEKIEQMIQSSVILFTKCER